MKDLCIRFWRDESGTAAIEYGLIAASISVPLAHGAQQVAAAIRATFETLTAAMN